MERLGDVIICSQIKAFELVIERILGRNDQHPGLRVFLLDIFEQIQAISVRKVDVEYYYIVIVRKYFILRFKEIRSRLTDKILLLQVYASGIQQFKLILNNQ